MLRRLLIKFGLTEASIPFYGNNTFEIASFVCFVKTRAYVEAEIVRPLTSAEDFQLDGVFLRALIPSGNRGARLGMRDCLYLHDGIAFLMDTTSAEALRDSKGELHIILSDNAISQPILVLVKTQDASGCQNDPDVISRFELGHKAQGGGILPENAV